HRRRHRGVDAPTRERARSLGDGARVRAAAGRAPGFAAPRDRPRPPVAEAGAPGRLQSAGRDRGPLRRGRTPPPHHGRTRRDGEAGRRTRAPPAPQARRGQASVKLSERFDRRYQQTPATAPQAPVTGPQQQVASPQTPVDGTPTAADRERLVDILFDEVIGLGPLEAPLRDPDITEIMVNRPEQIFVERRGRIELTNLAFEDEASLRRVIDRIVSTIGRRVDESEPMCDARLKDGSRVNVVIPPVAIYGPCLTIRKFGREVLTPEKIVATGGSSEAILEYLDAAVKTRLNIIVSGGTGSGKTTLLNVLSGFIPANERIVTCEDAAELRLRQVHVISLESKPANVEGHGQIMIRDLVRNSLRMRPDRIIVG